MSSMESNRNGRSLEHVSRFFMTITDVFKCHFFLAYSMPKPPVLMT